MPEANGTPTIEEIEKAIEKSITKLQDAQLKKPTFIEKYVKEVLVGLTLMLLGAVGTGIVSVVKMNNTLSNIEENYVKKSEIDDLVTSLNTCKSDLNYNFSVIADKLNVKLKKIDLN